jgi:transposase
MGRVGNVAFWRVYPLRFSPRSVRRNGGFSSAITLFSEVMKGVGRNRKDDGRKKGRIYQFITNNWDITDEQVALMYKYHWSIELVFKKLKQNFQLHFFYSESANGIKTQIWATLIAHLLLTVLKKKSNSNKAFSTIAALIRIHFISHLCLYWVIENGRRSYQKRTKSRNKVPDGIQMLLFD